VSVGIGGFQKVDLRSPRPGVPRGSGIAFHRAGTGERARVAVLMSTTPDEPESQALQSGTSLNSSSLMRVVMGNPPAGRSPLDKIVNPPEGSMWWLHLAYAPHLRQKAGGACSPLMRRGVFSVNFALWGAPREEFLDMCDYSLHHVASRPARVGDKLVTTQFNHSITRGFAAVGEPNVAVCLLPGTEVAFEKEIEFERGFGLFSSWTRQKRIGDKVARFRQLNADKPNMHHDALEFPDGEILLVTRLCEGQHARVLQLPASPPHSAKDEAERKHAAVVG
jgi:hypothetical protein